MGFLQMLVSVSLLTLILVLYLPQVGVSATWSEVLAALVVAKALALFLMPTSMPVVNVSLKSKTEEEKK